MVFLNGIIEHRRYMGCQRISFKKRLYGRKDNWTLVKNGSGFKEVAPEPVRNLALKRTARKSALIRYAVVNLNLPGKLFVFNQLLYADARNYEAGIGLDTELLSDQALLYKMLSYVLAKIDILSNENNLDVVILIDGNRQAIYAGQDPKASETHKLNSALLAVSDRFDLATVDLTDAFHRSWRQQKQPFNSEIDHHWNQFGHEVVAEALTHSVLSHLGLEPARAN